MILKYIFIIYFNILNIILKIKIYLHGYAGSNLVW